MKVKSDPFDGIDPLTANLNELDPLTRMVVDQEQITPYSNTNIRSSRDTFEPWSFRKSAILSRFTTQEKLSITTSIYVTESGKSVIQSKLCQSLLICVILIKEVRGVSEKVLHRLEQLDLDSGSKQFFGGLSQEEYTHKVFCQVKLLLCA